MMVLELAFTDAPERLAARPAHRERLTALHERGSLVAAGPWADDTGALLIFDTDRDGLDAILDADPYYRAPGVRIAAVREWAPVVGPQGPASAPSRPST